MIHPHSWQRFLHICNKIVDFIISLNFSCQCIALDGLLLRSLAKISIVGSAARQFTD